MEIIIGMVIAFILGAYVRKPFKLPTRQVKVLDEQEQTKDPYVDQLNDLIGYTGVKRED